jgi:hypothetical protein
MRVLSYVYDSAARPCHVDAVLEELASREEAVELVDVAGDAARRDAMLTVKGAVRIGSPPDELFDEEGRPDFSAGALVTEAETGRRTLHVGEEALAALRGSA